MFKHSYTSSVSRYIINNNLQPKIFECVENFILKLELSLLQNAYNDILNKKEKIKDIELNNISKKYKNKLLKKRIEDIKSIVGNINILKLNKDISKSLLIVFYEHILREEMVEHKSFFEIDDYKKNKDIIIPITYKEFLKSTDKTDYFGEFEKWVTNIFKQEKEFEKFYLDRPLYFFINRIRNNILNEGLQPICSLKYMNNIIKYIQKQYIKESLDKFNEKYFNTIKNFDNFKEAIFNTIHKETLKYLENWKTVEEGKRIVKEVKKKIDDDNIFTNIKYEYSQKIKKENGIQRIYEDFLEYQKIYIDNVKKYSDNINSVWLKEDLKDYIRYSTCEEIIDSYNESIDIFLTKEELQNIENNISIIIKEKFIKKEQYKVIVKIKNVKLNEEECKEVSNISFLSCKYVNDNIEDIIGKKLTNIEKSFFEKSEKEIIYSIINDVTVLKEDIEFAIKVAKDKIDEILNIVTFFEGNSQAMGYEICETYVRAKNGSINISSPKIRFSKTNLDLFKSEIGKFYTISNENALAKDLISCIKQYNLLINTQIKNMNWLVKINRELINAINIDECIKIMTVLIAGDNINKYTCTLQKLRLWLIEDYFEFFYSPICHDDFNYERFLSFFKKALIILYSYYDVLDKDTRRKVCDWILKIFPNEYEHKENTYE